MSDEIILNNLIICACLPSKKSRVIYDKQKKNYEELVFIKRNEEKINFFILLYGCLDDFEQKK